MHLKGVKIGLVLLVLGAGAAALARLNVRTDQPFAARIVAIEQSGVSKIVTVEFQKRDPSARFDETPIVRARVAGRWQEPRPFPILDASVFLERTNFCEQVDFAIPAQADACRFSMAYRSGTNPYCRAYFVLFHHGLIQRFPNASKLALKPIPRQARLRHAEFDLMIPPGLQQDGSLSRENLLRDAGGAG